MSFEYFLPLLLTFNFIISTHYLTSSKGLLIDWLAWFLKMQQPALVSQPEPARPSAAGGSALDSGRAPPASGHVSLGTKHTWGKHPRGPSGCLGPGCGAAGSLSGRAGEETGASQSC